MVGILIRTRIGMDVYGTNTGIRAVAAGEHEAGIGGDFAHDTIEVLHRAHHRPEMLHRLRAFESRQAGLGHRFQRFAGGIRDEMQVKEAR